MLQYNTWTIEQDAWMPAEEKHIQQQLTFSNDYLCQTAHFEEHYSGDKRLCTYIKGLDTPILNISAISIRLHDERLDLAEWQVREFHRCLHKNQPLLERRFLAVSPIGHTLEITSERRLLAEKKEAMQLQYTVRSVDYSGPITILSVLRGGDEGHKWYSLMNYVGDDLCWTWEQLQPMNVQVCCAMNYQLFKNGHLLAQRPIKVEKQEVIGYSITHIIQPNDVFTLHKNVVVLDSLRNNKDTLIDQTVQCLTNW